MRFEIKKVGLTESTNSDLKALARQGAPEGTVLLAKEQSGGRGRLGRSFSSGEGGLYMSIILPYKKSDDAGRITTCAAVAVARAIERLAPVEVSVKWVNDLYVNGKKLCGILAELVADENRTAVVLGIGVNLTNKLPDELSGIATTLYECCERRVSPDELCEAILGELSDFEKIDFKEYLEEYRHRCFVLGKKIEVIPHNGEKYAAFALGLLDDGALLVKRLSDGEEIRLFGGEVSAKVTEDET